MIAAETHRSYDDGGVRIVCSPLGRARETARILARVFDIAGYPCEGPMPDERLTERFYGTFEGKTYEEIAREQPEAYRVYRDTGECAGAEVERSEVVGERFRDAVLDGGGRVPRRSLSYRRLARLRYRAGHRFSVGPGPLGLQRAARRGQLPLVGARPRWRVHRQECCACWLAPGVAQYRGPRGHPGGLSGLRGPRLPR